MPGQTKKPRPKAETQSDSEESTGRIAKWLARAGVASRRDAERMIAQGRVKVDGTVLTTPAFKVTPTMKVAVDEVLVKQPEKARLWRYHKPTGLVTTHKDPEGRPTVFGALPRDMGRVISVGRLDLNSEGLLLLTNDGALARRLELPATGWIRRYRVRVFGKLDDTALERITGGVTIDGVRYGKVEAKIDRAHATYPWVSIAITEGKNREVRKLMEYLGVRVARLIRVSFGPFHLGQLEPGTIAEVPARAIAAAIGSKVIE